MDEQPWMAVRRSGELIAAGQTRRTLRSKAWTGDLHGVRVRADVELSPVQLRVATAMALMTERCVLGGWAALWTIGNGWFDGGQGERERPVLVHCEPGSQLRVRRGLRPSEGLLHPDEVVDLEGLRVATPARAAYDEMCRATDVRSAVVAADMATSVVNDEPHTSTQAIERVLSSHHKVRGIVQARRALALSSPRSASPWETRTRLVAQLDAGLRSLTVNVPIFDLAGGFLGVVDLLDEESGLVIEVDGAHHREVDRHAADNVREEKQERAGLVVVRVSPLDHQDRWSLVGRLMSAHRDAQRSTRRAWTIDEPDWWRSRPSAERWRRTR